MQILCSTWKQPATVRNARDTWHPKYEVQHNRAQKTHMRLMNKAWKIHPVHIRVQTVIQKSVTSKPVGFELNSNMHTYYAFDDHIYSLSSVNTCKILVWQTHFVFCVYANNLEMVHMCIMPITCYIQSLKYFNFRPYLFLHIYDPFGIPCMPVTFLSLVIQLILTYLLYGNGMPV